MIVCGSWVFSNPVTYVSVLYNCTANNRCPEVTGCSHVRLATTINYNAYKVHIQLKVKIKIYSTEKAAVAASWLLNAY